MAQESCNLDKDEAEILKPSSSSSSSSSPSPPSATPLIPQSAPTLFIKPSSQEFQYQMSERLEMEPVFAGTPKSEEEVPPVRPINRCWSCGKKVGLTGFRCRCGELFCPRHRYSELHDCSFDYKAVGREEISKANPVIRAAKIIKI